MYVMVPIDWANFGGSEGSVCNIWLQNDRANFGGSKGSVRNGSKMTAG